MHHVILVFHLLAATIWIGGHLTLSIGFLPKALKQKDPAVIINFEKSYEKIGLPALLILVITGILMAYLYGVTLSHWFSFDSPIEKIVSVKLLLLLSTLALAIHARLFIIPKLSARSLPLMAAHIILITLIGITMMVVGTFVRFGGL